MHKLIALLFCCFISTPLFAQTPWQEGTHYEVVSEQLNPRLGIVEVFSFWCPACYRFETIVEKIKARKHESLGFTKAHVDFLGGASQQAQQDATKALLIARAVGKEDSFVLSLFTDIHVNTRRQGGIERYKELLEREGVSGEKFDKLANSFGLKSHIARNNKLIKGIRQVPTFMINGKYKAIFTRDMTPDQFVDLVLWLAEQP